MPFGRIAEIIERVLDRHPAQVPADLEASCGADRWARATTHEELA